MLMQGRIITSFFDYNFGFGGKEKDDEAKGTGMSLNFGNRIDDSRVGRWNSLDKVTRPWMSPYVYSADNPVNNIDPDGKDEIHFHFYNNSVIGPDGKALSGHTSARIEIIKANGPDKFFAHMHSTEIRMPTNYSSGGQATNERTIEFYPWNPDSRSGLTKSTILGMIPWNDRDYATLMKYTIASPSLKEYIKGRSEGYEANFYDRENYKGLIADLPVYKTLGKIKQGADIGLAIVGAIDAGLAGATTLGATETFYRTMSASDFNLFQKTGKLPATGETFISPTKGFSSGYERVLVQFNTKAGTISQLQSIGVRNSAIGHPFSDLPLVNSGWGQSKAFFKLETNSEGLQQVNIGLGKGKALELFNNNIQSYKVINR
jgi:RHS repeat-associated protein